MSCTAPAIGMRIPSHFEPMRRFEKGSQAWYSHKADDGTWCRGKAKK
jgi:hypothetical protein